MRLLLSKGATANAHDSARLDPLNGSNGRPHVGGAIVSGERDSGNAGAEDSRCLNSFLRFDYQGQFQEQGVAESCQ